MMNTLLAAIAVVLLVALSSPSSAQSVPDDNWTIYILNDNCPDYTWGFTEQQTRRAFADIVRAHLDEMKRTDDQPPHNQDRYNMAVAQEAICFVEHYPDRKDELIGRIREGRILVSPYLCNTLWAFHGVEGVLRAFYPARRLEQEWGIPIDVAHHIELPSLPWGTATLLAGSGIRWLNVPYLAYDSTFGNLSNPPLFVYEGPDGSQLRVVLDRFASSSQSYTQGAHLLRNPDAIARQWLGHYAKLGGVYATRAILASGTHGDINPDSGRAARGFADAIIKYNSQPQPPARLVNATLRQFTDAVDMSQANAPFLPTIRGCFGHSWDLWPISLSKYATAMREGERRLLAAEALLAVAMSGQPEVATATTSQRRRAEWCLSMLSDHAWNGTDDRNKKHNADLRKSWSEELNYLADKLIEQGWAAAGVTPTSDSVVIFNSLSILRADLVRVAVPEGISGVAHDGQALVSQIVEEDGQRWMYFVSPRIPGFAMRQLALTAEPAPVAGSKLSATASALESPFYRLSVDAKSGGISSLVHKATGRELIAAGGSRTLLQNVYHDGQERPVSDVNCQVIASGPVLARLRVTGKIGDIDVTQFITAYADLDRIDVDIRFHKPVSTQQQYLCQMLPVLREGAAFRIETTGAVIRPQRQPAGDLLPGADPRRFAVQGFVEASTAEASLTIATIDAFMLRTDLGVPAFQAIGNDQNYKEVTRDQHGQTDFRFRYSLQARVGDYSGPAAFAFSRSAATPLLVKLGRLDGGRAMPSIAVDPSRAVATALKPADDGRGVILRLWETAGAKGSLSLRVSGYQRLTRTDLLERDEEALAASAGAVELMTRPLGFASLRLEP